jgi:threonyl-tRNA synthetase
LLEERKERDHRKIGKELELFTNSQLVGAGLPLWLPNNVLLILFYQRKQYRIYVVTFCCYYLHASMHLL